MSAAENPPPWEVPPPKSGNEIQLGPLTNAFAWWVAGVVTVVVGARLATRKWITDTRFWWDDFFITAALISTLIGAALDSVEVHYHLGQHEHYVTEHDLFYFTAYTYGEWIQTFLTLACAKISICFFLLRIPVNKRFTIPLKIFIGITGVSHLVLILLWILQCIPVQAAWNPNRQGKCFSRNQKLHIILAQAVISIFGDFALALYPALIFSKLNMSVRQKLGLSLLMGLGVVAGACGIVRAVLNQEAIPMDATFGGLPNWFWRLFEVNLGIICACIPTLVPGFKWLRARWRTRFSRASSDEKPSPAARGSGTQADDLSETRRGRSGPRSRNRNRTRSRRRGSPREPEPALLSSRTDRAVLGRAHDISGSSADLEAQLSSSVRAEAPTPLDHASSQGSRGTFFRQSSSVSDAERRQHQRLVPASVEKSDAPARNASLDVDLGPQFEDNRTVWKRMFSDNRLSWWSKSRGSSTRASKYDG